MALAVGILRELAASGRTPLVVDLGCGGGWAARSMPWATVVAIDLIAAAHASGSFVRADMRRLPLLDRSSDGLLFAASLHYAAPEDVIPEAARVLRPGGLLVAVDSPMYADRASQAAATARSDAYYRDAGLPELALSYHPICVGDLRAALQGSGFQVERWRTGTGVAGRIRRLVRNPPSSLVVARLT